MPATKNTPNRHHPWRWNVTTSMIELRNGHIPKNVTKIGEPHVHSCEHRRRRKRRTDLFDFDRQTWHVWLWLTEETGISGFYWQAISWLSFRWRTVPRGDWHVWHCWGADGGEGGHAGVKRVCCPVSGLLQLSGPATKCGDGQARLFWGNNNDNNDFISIVLFHVKHAQLRWTMPMNNTHTRARMRAQHKHNSLAAVCVYKCLCARAHARVHMCVCVCVCTCVFAWCVCTCVCAW